jgi:hypothetical protein
MQQMHTLNSTTQMNEETLDGIPAVPPAQIKSKQLENTPKFPEDCPKGICQVFCAIYEALYNDHIINSSEHKAHISRK